MPTERPITATPTSTSADVLVALVLDVATDAYREHASAAAQHGDTSTEATHAAAHLDGVTAALAAMLDIDATPAADLIAYRAI